MCWRNGAAYRQWSTRAPPRGVISRRSFLRVVSLPPSIISHLPLCLPACVPGRYLLRLSACVYVWPCQLNAGLLLSFSRGFFVVPFCSSLPALRSPPWLRRPVSLSLPERSSTSSVPIRLGCLQLSRFPPSLLAHLPFLRPSAASSAPDSLPTQAQLVCSDPSWTLLSSATQHNTTQARLPDNNPPHPLPQPCSGTTHTSRRTPWTRSS